MENARFVIKYGELGKGRKIKDEYNRFQEYVAVRYSARYEFTGTHEGIKYGYASSDERIDSHSFSDIVDDLIARDKAPAFPPNVAISELFGGALFPHWQKTQRRVAKQVSELYSDYLNKKDKILETIGFILN